MAPTPRTADGAPAASEPAAPVLPLALTMGDPAGIGPDITLTTWRERHARSLPPFVVFGDPDVLAARALTLGLAAAIEPVDTLEGAAAIFEARLPVWPLRCAAPVVAGTPDARNAPAVIAAIETAVAHVQRGGASAVVTNPIAKSVLAASGFTHPGHTEFLGALAMQQLGAEPVRPVMLLAATELRVVPLTVHIPLARVPAAISTELIVETARVLHRGMTADFGIAAPRIAVTGLNPHAGEDGTMGREDLEIIAPAIAALRRDGLAVTGPHPADTLFHAEARTGYDAVLAMYHDQALIPIKTLAFDTGVNVTLGLPFVRTSPDHGTAFSIAGRGRARDLSLTEALRLAHTLAARRRAAAVAANGSAP